MIQFCAGTSFLGSPAETGLRLLTLPLELLSAVPGRPSCPLADSRPDPFIYSNLLMGRLQLHRQVLIAAASVSESLRLTVWRGSESAAVSLWCLISGWTGGRKPGRVCGRLLGQTTQ